MDEEIRIAPEAPKLNSKGERMAPPPAHTSQLPRRGFLTQATAVVAGGAVVTVPLAAGLIAYSDPVIRGKSQALEVRVAPLDALPADGVPRPFQIIAEYRDDAWNRTQHEPIGSVFLRRMPNSETVQAFNATCPHAGCFVSFDDEAKRYECPCHNSGFDLNGAAIFGPPPRGLDSLETRLVEHDGTRYVAVKFQEFYTGIAEKKAKA